jgi:hypothetical protein
MLTLIKLISLEFFIFFIFITISLIFKKNIIKYIFITPLFFILFVFFIENRQAEYLFINLSFILIFLEFYSLITRGFSISILLSLKYDLSINSKKKLIDNYAQKGLVWFTENRIEGLVKLGFIRKFNNKFYINNLLFKFLAISLILVKKIFNLNNIK